MLDWLKTIWDDPVWSKVIAGGLLAVAGSVWASIRFHWWKRLTRSPELTIVNKTISPQPSANYALKYYIDFRNDSSKCVEVKMSRYLPETITLKKFVHEVMQLRFHSKWFPSPEGAAAVGVLPGQLCRAWLGIDEKKFTDSQVTACEGRIGTLVIVVNKKECSFRL